MSGSVRPSDPPATDDAGSLNEETRLRRAVDDERTLLDRLARMALLLASEIPPDHRMQWLTEEATAVVGALYGAFFETVPGEPERYALIAFAGEQRAMFEELASKTNTAELSAAFEGDVVRLDDVTTDGPTSVRFAAMSHGGRTGRDLGIVSCLVIPVRSTSGGVAGALFFGHPETARFGERDQRAGVALSALAGIALDNARLQRELSAREAANLRLRLLNEAAHEGLWYWDIATNIVEWNDGMLAMMGVDRAHFDAEPSGWLERVHPDDHARVSAALDAHLHRREPYVIDRLRVRHGSGEYRWFTAKGQAEWDAEGRPLRMAGSMREIAGDAPMSTTRAVERRYRKILDSVQDAIVCRDRSMRVVYANAAACRYYGMSIDELHAVRHLDASDADDLEVFATGHTVERRNEPTEVIGGEIRYIHVIKSPIFDDGGSVIEVVTIVRDVNGARRISQLPPRQLAEP